MPTPNESYAPIKKGKEKVYEVKMENNGDSDEEQGLPQEGMSIKELNLQRGQNVMICYVKMMVESFAFLKSMKTMRRIMMTMVLIFLQAPVVMGRNWIQIIMLSYYFAKELNRVLEV